MSKRGSWIGLILLGLLLTTTLLTACGQDATATPVATTQAVGNPIIVTITAGASGKTGQNQPAKASPTEQVAHPVAGLTDLPVYDGLKTANLGDYGNQLAAQFSQFSKSSKTALYHTAANFDKVSAFYEAELPKQGYTRQLNQTLPEASLLSGNLLTYTKKDNNLAIIGVGPLDADLVANLNSASGDLKAGETLVIFLTGLSDSDFNQLQSQFTQKS